MCIIVIKSSVLTTLKSKSGRFMRESYAFLLKYVYTGTLRTPNINKINLYMKYAGNTRRGGAGNSDEFPAGGKTKENILGRSKRVYKIVLVCMFSEINYKIKCTKRVREVSRIGSGSWSAIIFCLSVRNGKGRGL